MTRAYERLLRYAAIDTGSDETSEVTPSSPGQIVLADKLAEELRELGVSDVYVDEHAYVYGKIPASAGYETRDEKSRTFSSNSQRSHILRTSSRSIRLILSSIVSFAVWLKWTRTI